MKFGLHYGISCSSHQSPLQRYQDTLEQATYAEALGFESVWPLEQHFVPDFSILPSPLLLLAALSQRTRNLRLGIAVMVMQLTHPVRVAEDIATLDILSNGRVEFGAGRLSGRNPLQSRGTGISQSESRERLIEGLEVIRQAWTQERLSFNGRFFQVEDIPVVPKPIQRPHPPMRVAATSADAFERMGQLGYSIFTAMHTTSLPKLRELVPTYRQARKAAGHPDRGGEDLTILLPLYVGENRAQIRHDMEPNVRKTQRFMEMSALSRRDALRDGVSAEAEHRRVQEAMELAQRFTYENMCESMAIFDSPDACAERLESIRHELNSGRVICWFNMGGLIPHEKVMRSMELFAAKVMPRFETFAPATISRLEERERGGKDGEGEGTHEAV